jgi:hypothetical protein
MTPIVEMMLEEALPTFARLILSIVALHVLVLVLSILAKLGVL